MGPLKRVVAVTAFVFGLAAGCAHAPPVTGNRAPNAELSIQHPEVNCSVNNSVDCRPEGGP